MENCTSRAPLHMWRWPSLAATPARENHRETSVRSIWDAWKCNILCVCIAEEEKRTPPLAGNSKFPKLCENRKIGRINTPELCAHQWSPGRSGPLQAEAPH